MRHLFENKPLLLAGGLNVNRAEIKDGGEQTFDFGSDVLNAVEFLFGDGAGEKAFHFNIDNPFIGDKPNVKIIINKRKKHEEPDVKVKNTGE